MDPNFNPALYDYIGMYNIDDEPFDVIYNNQNYARLAPQQVVKLPRFLVDHALKHLIDKILNKRNIATNNRVERELLSHRIVVNEEVPNRPAYQTEDDKIKSEIETMNVPSDLDNILARKGAPSADPSLGAPPVVQNPLGSILHSNAPAPLPPTTPTETLLDEEGQPITEAPPVPTVTPPTPPPSAAPAVPLGVAVPVAPPPTDAPIDNTNSQPVITNDVSPQDPTREALYDYAQNTMKMDLTDSKTKAALDNMNVDQLKTELQWTPPLATEPSTNY